MIDSLTIDSVLKVLTLHVFSPTGAVRRWRTVASCPPGRM